MSFWQQLANQKYPAWLPKIDSEPGEQLSNEASMRKKLRDSLLINKMRKDGNPGYEDQPETERHDDSLGTHSFHNTELHRWRVRNPNTYNRHIRRGMQIPPPGFETEPYNLALWNAHFADIRHRMENSLPAFNGIVPYKRNGGKIGIYGGSHMKHY
jgi:hypothetical protein